MSRCTRLPSQYLFTLRCYHPSTCYWNFHYVKTRFKHRLYAQTSPIDYIYLSIPHSLIHLHCPLTFTNFFLHALVVHWTTFSSSYFISFRCIYSYTIQQPIPPKINSSFKTSTWPTKTSFRHASPTRNPCQPAANPADSVYSYINDTFSDFIDLIEGPVSGEKDGGTRHNINNAQNYAALRWYIKNHIPGGDPKTEEQSREYRTWLENSLFFGSCSKTSASSRVPQTVVHFSYMDNSLSCLSVKQYQCSSSALLVQEYYNYNYGHEISGCWTRGKLRSRYVRAPSLMKRIAQVIPCGLAAILFMFSAYRSKFLCRMICYRYTKSHHSCVCNRVHLTNYVH